MSDRTKRALSKSLVKILETKPLDKITISDLTNDCHVNRQTFYYHFKDIYDLVEWMYITTAKEAVGTNKTSQTWQEGMLGVFHVMKENQSFVLKTFHSRTGQYLESMLLRATRNLVMSIVKEIALNHPIPENKIDFIANFYKYAFTGVFIQWIEGDMKENPKVIVKNLENLLQGTIAEASKRFSTEIIGN